MIEFRTGDIFASGADGLVDPVNCEGVSGKGLALEFMQRYPAAIAQHHTRCRRGDVEPGVIYSHYVESRILDVDGVFILFFPTKTVWRQPSKIEYIEAGLDRLPQIARNLKIKRLALPALGCGLGNLSWDEVKPLMEEKLARLGEEIDVYVYTPL